MDALPTIAVIGRPNVGKSTLFNRLIGKRQAIVSAEPGTTRDRISETFDCNGYQTILVDTGGLRTGENDDMEADIQTQAKTAISDADLIFFVIDISQDPTVEDFAATDLLRKSAKPVILIGNKFDHEKLEANAYNFFELGFDEPIKVSAIHKLGIGELKDKTAEILKNLKFKKGQREQEPATTGICILGRPNSGKSSLVNALIGSKKIIVSDIPGTTRDSIDTSLDYNNRKFKLIDTAGIKRRGRIGGGIEKFSIMRSLQAIERCDIVVLIIDGTGGITNQDCHITQYALEQAKGIIIAINKMDLLEGDTEAKNRLISQLKRRFPFIPWVPVIFISALKKENIFEILNQAKEIMEERKKQIPAPEFNAFIQKITRQHLPASSKTRKPAFQSASQVDISPPKFLLNFKNPQNLHFSYPRYLENKIRENYGFRGTSIDIKFK